MGFLQFEYTLTGKWPGLCAFQNGGLIVTASATTILRGGPAQAAAVYSFRDFVTTGGLISVALILPTGFGARLATSAASSGE